MKKIIFVCLGNICRSPMAEYVFKALAEKCGKSDCFDVQSRATSYEEVGNPVYPPARAELERHGVFCGNHRATRLTYEDCATADYIICMDDGNVRAAKRIAGDVNGEKIVKLAAFYGSDEDIADPWYSRRFDIVFSQIERGAKGLLNILSERD